MLHEAGAPVYNHSMPDRSLYERTKAVVRSRPGRPAFEEARAKGQEMPFEQAVEYALEDDEASPTQAASGASGRKIR